MHVQLWVEELALEIASSYDHVDSDDHVQRLHFLQLAPLIYHLNLEQVKLVQICWVTLVVMVIQVKVKNLKMLGKMEMSLGRLHMSQETSGREGLG